MKRFTLTVVAALFLTVASFADEYEKACAEILNKVKSGETAVDYAALRQNCGRTSWYVQRKQTQIDKIRKEMFEAANAGKHEEVKKLELPQHDGAQDAFVVARGSWRFRRGKTTP